MKGKYVKITIEITLESMIMNLIMMKNPQRYL